MLNLEQDLFEMANLYPATTGLPMTVWVFPRGHAEHDARVKVNTTDGRRMDLDNAAVMSVRPVPRLIEGELSSGDQTATAKWITLGGAPSLQAGAQRRGAGRLSCYQGGDPSVDFIQPRHARMTPRASVRP